MRSLAAPSPLYLICRVQCEASYFLQYVTNANTAGWWSRSQAFLRTVWTCLEELYNSYQFSWEWSSKLGIWTSSWVPGKLWPSAGMWGVVTCYLINVLKYYITHNPWIVKTELSIYTNTLCSLFRGASPPLWYFILICYLYHAWRLWNYHNCNQIYHHCCI